MLIAALIVFIIAKLPVLYYPFYWDESWSYAPAIKLMYLHGPSLMPNAIDIFYSRGHPLLFYAGAAAWMRIFGDSHVAQHSFALFISACLLVTVYEACLRLFNRRVAIISLLLVATQVVFFVQSTLLLPEITIAWLSILTLYFYAAEKRLYTFLSLSALMLTKESGMALGLVLGVHAVVYLFLKGKSLAGKLKNFLSVAGAGSVILIFFAVQQKLNGWFLYPEHTALMDLSWDMFRGKLRFCLEIILSQQNRSYIFILVVALSAAAAIRARNARYAMFVLLGVVFYILTWEYYGFITRRVFIPFSFCLLIYSFYTLIKLNAKSATPGAGFIYLCIFFIAAYLSFTCLNFFTNRYLITAIFVFLILAAYCFDSLLSVFSPPFFYGLLASIATIAFFAFKSDKGIGDVDLGAYSAMRVQESVVRYCEEQNLYRKNIAAHSPLERAHLTLPYTGFLSYGKIFEHVSIAADTSTEYIINDNIEIDSSFAKEKYPAFQSVFQVSDGGASAEILRRK